MAYFSPAQVTGSGALVFGTSPDLSSPTVTTQTAGNNSTLAASTAFVTTAITNALPATFAKIVATGNLLAQSATVASVATYTTPNDSTVHSFRVGGYTSITAISAGTLTITATFTDQNGTSRSVTYFPMGLTSAGLTSTGFTAFEPINIRCNPNTAITFVATFAGVSITYDVGATIESLY